MESADVSSVMAIVAGARSAVVASE
jgi:hypothetical protein